MNIDINCDLGEEFPYDEQLMPYISSANIACGEHAGSYKTIVESIELCKKYGVAIGAHPGFRDKENFGRKEMDVSDYELFHTLVNQILTVILCCNRVGVTLHHVKPHGALYNMAARDANISKTIVKAITYFKNQDLIVYGLSNSYLISEAAKAGLKTAAEVFADRRYTDGGYLVPRSEPNAIIENDDIAVEQALGFVRNRSKKRADTICIHGDNEQALSFAKKINQSFKANNIGIQTV
jgi:5-oxoprolinase (ATP-hydrolysing) subunit A